MQFENHLSFIRFDRDKIDASAGATFKTDNTMYTIRVPGCTALYEGITDLLRAKRARNSAIDEGFRPVIIVNERTGEQVYPVEETNDTP